MTIDKKKEIRFDYVKCSKRIRELRKERDESHSTLGAAVGTSEQLMKNYEQAALQKGISTGQDRVTSIAGMNINTLCRLADHFGVSTDYLLGRTDTRSVEPDMQTASMTTGLSEKAIGLLQVIRLNPGYMRAVNYLLEQIAFYREVIGAVKKILDSLTKEEIDAEELADDEFALLDQLEGRGWLIGSPLAAALIYSDRAGIALHSILENTISFSEPDKKEFEDLWIKTFNAENE